MRTHRTVTCFRTSQPTSSISQNHPVNENRALKFFSTTPQITPANPNHPAANHPGEAKKTIDRYLRRSRLRRFGRGHGDSKAIEGENFCARPGEPAPAPAVRPRGIAVAGRPACNACIYILCDEQGPAGQGTVVTRVANHRPIPRESAIRHGAIRSLHAKKNSEPFASGDSKSKQTLDETGLSGEGDPIRKSLPGFVGIRHRWSFLGFAGP